jgi:nitrite reductase (NADH) small subunit
MWVEVAKVADLAKARKLAVQVGDRPIGLFWHDDQPYAFDNVCIHKQRELTGGVILNGRIVCPGHQWAYELGTGWCRERERSQPTFPARVDGDVVLIEVP